VSFFRRGGSKSPAESDPAALGRRGERIACKFLKRSGMKILARNYDCPGGEVDLIALEPAEKNLDRCDTLVFVEVKTRSSDYYTSPAAAVDRDKRRRLKKAAQHYRDRRNTDDFAWRFDIISIVIPPGDDPRIEHLVAAFR